MSERWQRQTDELDESRVTEALLASTGIAAGDLPAIIAAIARRGWSWRITGGAGTDPRLCSAAIIVPWRDSTPWTEGTGDTPAVALGEALARAIANPPPANGEIARNGLRDWGIDDRLRFFD